MNRKKIVVALAGGTVALSLVGAGVGASYSSSASAAQEASTGSINLLAATGPGDPGNTISAFGAGVSFNPADNLGSAGITKATNVEILNTGSLPAYIHSFTITHTGSLPINVSFPAGIVGAFNTSVLADGTYPVNTAFGANTFTVPANSGANRQYGVTFSVPADSPQGESGTVTVTANATDTPTP
jgi:hypothetical protein